MSTRSVGTVAIDAVRGVIASAEERVASLYLNVDGRVVPRASDVDAKLAHLVRETRAISASKEAKVRAAAEGAVEALSRRLTEGVDRSRIRGLAVFYATPSSQVTIFELEAPIHDAVAIDRVPHVGQLLEAIEYERLMLVVLVDHRSARLLHVVGSLASEQPGPRDESERQVDTDTELGSFERRHDEAFRQHLRRVAAAVAQATAQRDVRSLVIGGPAGPDLEPYLAQPDANRLAGTIVVSMDAAVDDVIGMARERLGVAQRDEWSRLVEELRARAGIGCTLGLEETSEALSEHRVRLLVVSRDFQSAGARCLTCGFLSAVGNRCGRCGASMEPVEDLIEAALAEAVASGAEVVFVPSSVLGEGVGMGAIERY